MMLSQLNSPQPEFAGYTLAFVVGLTAAAASIVAMIRGGKKQSRALEPDPLRVQTVPDLVTRDAFDKAHSHLVKRLDGHDKAIEAIRQEMKTDRENSESAARVRSAGIYNRIDDLRRELGDKMDAIRVESKNDTAGVHKRINDVLHAVGELKGRMCGT